MRILLVVHGFPPREPGVWTYHLAHYLSQKHSVWVYSGTEDSERPVFLQWEEQDGSVKVRRVVNNLLNPWETFDHFYSPQIDRQLMGFVEEIQPDVVHVEHVITTSATILEALHDRGIPTVLSLYDYWFLCHRIFLLRPDTTFCPGPGHEFDCVTCVEGRSSKTDVQQWRPAAVENAPGAREPGWGTRGRQTWKKRLATAATALSAADSASRPEKTRRLRHDFRLNLMLSQLSYPHIITACSEHLRDTFTRVAGLPPERVRVVELGVSPLPGPVEYLPSDKIRVGFLGSVGPHKGPHVLVEAVKSLGDPRIETHLYGACATEFEDHLKSIDDSVVMHGVFGREDLSGILGNLDIAVVPSLAAETFSFVIREIRQGGVALIASRVGAIPEFVTDGQNGLLVSPGSVSELAQAIHRLVTDSELRHRLAQNRTPVRSVEDYALEMESLYAEAIELKKASVTSVR